jgi:hypothetical protein
VKTGGRTASAVTAVIYESFPDILRVVYGLVDLEMLASMGRKPVLTG